MCEGFLSQAAATSVGLGMPNLPVAVIPGHPGAQSAQELRTNVHDITTQQVIDNLLTQPAETEMVRYYCGLAKRAVPDAALWEFYMAYNLFRVSCIRQGVYARSLDGTASNLRAADSGKLVRPAAELGWRLVEGIARLGGAGAAR